MATFESTGQTVFREGDPAVPDIAAELKGRRPVMHVAVSRGYSYRGGISGRLGRSCARGSEMTKRVLRALLRRDARSEGSRYDELDGELADGLKEEAERRGATEREVLREAVRLYLGGRREGGEP